MRSIAPALAVVLLCAACTPSGSEPPTASPRVEQPSELPPTPAPTAYATMAGDLSALVIPLDDGAAPIDAVDAFGSVWVANHRSNDIVRLDPETGEELARINLGAMSGPGWFAVTDDAIWVTRQQGLGMSRIDPETNTLATGQVGTRSPCWAPAVALGSVWYHACEDGLMMRIDAMSNDVTMIPAEGLSPPIAVDDTLYAVGTEGLVRWDPATEMFEPVGGCCGRPIAFGAGTIWLASSSALTRLEPDSGAEVGFLEIGGLTTLAFTASSAWGAVEGDDSVLEIDPATNQVIREIPVGPSPIKVLSAFGALWVTDFDSSTIWRITLD